MRHSILALSLLLFCSPLNVQAVPAAETDAAAIATSTLTSSAPAGLSVPTEVSFGTLVRLTMAVEEGDQVHWFLNSSRDFDSKRDAGVATLLFASGCKAATVTGDATVINWDARKYVRERFEVVIGGGDDGDDGPPPGKRQITIVYESEDNTSAFVLTTRAAQKYCRETGHDYLRLDKDVQDADGRTPARLREALDAIAEAGLRLPALVAVVDYKGTPYGWVQVLPGTAADMVKVLRVIDGSEK